ncbi:MAG TPA: acyl-ACP thioesterase domain-containing protein [Anaerolineae bacterium]|nr:acyl-ACP thioesterase domain-containing protein [Anaerolineae bacterium]
MTPPLQQTTLCYNPLVTDTLFTVPLTVALYDLDLRDEVSCSTIFRYFEETAMRGSAHFGFAKEWYRQRHQFWVIRTMHMERLCAPRYLDSLEIRTWVSSMARVRSDRNYEIRRVADGRLMARGVANWVFLDEASRIPTRIPTEISSRFQFHHPPTLEPIYKLALQPAASALFQNTTTRRAQFYEADAVQHVNNAVYVDWLEEAVRDALRALGYSLALDGTTPIPWFYRHALEYVRPAVPGDEITIHTRLLRRGHTFGEWEQEITHSQTRESLRAKSSMVWIDSANHVVAWRKDPSGF